MRKRGFLVLGAGLLMAVACGEAATNPPEVVEQSNTTTPTLPDGAPNPNFDPATVPPILPDGAPNPIFDASLPDGAVLPGFDAGRTDAGRDASTPPADAGRDSSTPPVDAGNPGTPGIIGIAGIASWDALAAAEKAKVNQFRSAFFHQSVGQDLEDGLKANGISIEFIDRNSTLSKPGFHGGPFMADNGQGVQKIDEWRNFSTRNGSTRLRVAIMKFGYADLTAGSLASVQAAYLSATNTLKNAGIRVLHVTPPLVFDQTENPPKLSTRQWMLTTFPTDVIFDLSDIESTDAAAGGTRCQVGGVWHICQSVRSRTGCASLSQGIDGPGQGHLCYQQAIRISKAYAYAIYQAGK